MKGPSSRDVVLARIDEALRVVAAPPHDHTESPIESQTPQDWLPAAAASEADRIAQFAQRSLELNTSFHCFDSIATLINHLQQLAIDERWQCVGVHRSPLIESIASELSTQTLWTDGGYAAADLERCDASITACDALIAQTGSVVVTSKSAGGRALSVLPPHHIVIARRRDLLPDLPAAFRLLESRYAGAMPSFASLITGPSRTGDIERILVLGAHGPRQLSVMVF